MVVLAALPGGVDYPQRGDDPPGAPTVTGPLPVGRHLAQELADRGWTQTAFAEILGRPIQFISAVITGKKEITRESAAQFGAALDTSPEHWLQLQAAYHLWSLSRDPVVRRSLSEVRRRARRATARKKGAR